MAAAHGQTPKLSPVEKIVPAHLSLTKMPLISGLSSPALTGLHTPPAGVTKPKAALPTLQAIDLDAYSAAAEDAYIGGGLYYVNHLGFFCKRELDIQKTTHLPVFFRLGSLESCNRLEGK